MSSDEGLFVHQFELGPWDNFIYFIGDKATRSCAVVDPAWDADFISAEAERLGVQKEILPIRSVRSLGKSNMIRNTACPMIEVDTATFEVRADGALLHADPVTKVPLARSHFLR